MISNIKKKLKKNGFIFRTYDGIRKFYYKYLISDKKFLETRFKKRMGREVELESPLKYNDKLQWLKLNWYDPIATKCADKYAVREFVSETIGEQYLNELLAVYESVDEIDIEKLPDQFVLKGTHGSGFNVICTDKHSMDWDEEFRKMKRWLRTNYYLQNREWIYKDIKPRIVCERYLSDLDGQPPNDYKIFCFNGEPKLIAVDFAKYGDNKDEFYGLKRNIYDLKWELKDIQISVLNDMNQIHEKPLCLNEIINLSRILSKGFPHVRVDFFIVNNKVYFGELTFFNTSGMGKINPPEFEITMGDWIELP